MTLHADMNTPMQIDALRTDNKRLQARVEMLEEALEAYVSDFCEGFCAELPLDYADDVMLNDCSGCRARVCLATRERQ